MEQLCCAKFPNESKKKRDVIFRHRAFLCYRAKSNADEMERMRKQSQLKGGVLGRVCGIMKEKNTKQKGEIR